MLKKIINQASLVFSNKCQHADSQKFCNRYERVNLLTSIPALEAAYKIVVPLATLTVLFNGKNVTLNKIIFDVTKNCY